jgi:PAS domain S-box-containing protein
MATPLRLLILEDNPSDAELVLHTLRRAGYDPIGERVETEQEFLDQLQTPPEIILADFTMPELDALRALDIMQERQLDIPFIIVSGTIGEERAVQVMQHGATDYIIKDRLGRLGQAVRQALARWHLKEEKLKADQTIARLAAIVETSGDAILTKTLDGIITSWNRAAENLYGFSAHEIIGKHITILFPRGRRQSDAPEDFKDHMLRLKNGERLAAFETVRVRNDGRRIEVLLSMSPICDTKGVVTGVSAIALDITLRKRADRFLSAEQAVTGILTECKSLDEAGPRVLRMIAECLRWEVAVLWTIDRSANVLRRMHHWHATWADPVFVEALSQRTVLVPGEGVAGRTWTTGEPVWKRGILIDGPSRDTSAMTRDGLRCGFGLPMRQGMAMVGVIEFYNPELREPDKALVEALDNIACQISQFCEKRRTEAALRVSEERYRVLADNLPGCVFTSLPDGACDYCNQWWYDYTGLAEQDMLGTGWADCLHPESRQETLDLWAQATQNGESFQFESRFRGADGVYRWFFVRAAPLEDAEGRVIKWFGTCVDIDAQRRSLEELRISEERFRNLVMALPVAVYTTDQTGLITLFNKHAVELWGRRPEIGKDYWCGSWKLLRLDGSVLPLDQCPMAVALRDGVGIQSQELILERPDGSRAYVLKHPEPLRGAGGEIIGAVNMVIDLTKMKQLEEQYRQSQKLEAIGQLAGGVAHDFNNLLTIINGFSEMVMNRLPAGDKARDMLRQVVDAGDRAADLTRQLLAFSRKALIAPKALDLKVVVADVDKMLRRLVGEHIEMTIVSDAEVGSVTADVGQIEQVILNLVVNAGDAMPQGGQLTIEVRNVVLDEAYARDHVDAQTGQYVLLAVSDTGCGMDEATMARIFEPFFTTKGDRGTGLGLATVHGIVKQNGGHVSAYSEVGVGTSFKIYLPHTAQRPFVRAPQPALEALPRGSETVLIVEDEDGVRALSHSVLEDCGYRVLDARDGVDALRVAGEHLGHIDLLVTDVVMPRMGGREVAERLATTRPATKVLFLSGYTDDAVVRHGIFQAQVSFLQKPFRPALLVMKIREVLDKKTEGNLCAVHP